MEPLMIYRKRIIPNECILLKNDTIVSADDKVIVTKWQTINPKVEFSHGCSCYFLDQGIKVSKFLRHDGSLLYWYCDIVDYDYNAEENTLVVTDLLADVIVRPDGTSKVLDLDEMADALNDGLITTEQISTALRRLNDLLTVIYRDRFDRLQAYLEGIE